MRLNKPGAQISATPAQETPAAGKPHWRTSVARIDWSSFALLSVTLVGLCLRLFAINWDANNHLHPDERKITMVAMCLGWKSVPPGCPPVPDPANPHFFAYGSFPMYLLALVSHGLAALFHGHAGWPTDGGTFDDYNHITLVGRALSALFDTGTILVVGMIARRLIGRWWAVFAAAFVALAAFEVQLAHFYAVDTVLTFFVTLTLYGALGLAGCKHHHMRPGQETADQPSPADMGLADLPPIRHTIAWALLTGLALGLAITSKVSAIPLVVPIGMALLMCWRRLGIAGWPDIALSATGIIGTALIAIITTMPYMFLDSQSFWQDVNVESALAKGVIVYPYTIQFTGRTPYLDQIKNLFFWDMGAVMTLAAGAGLIYALCRIWRHWDDILLIPVAWVAIYFGITGGFYTKFSRYQLPILPMLAVLATVALAALHTRLQANKNPENNQEHPQPSVTRRAFSVPYHSWFRWIAAGLAGIVLASGLVMTLAFLNIYTQPVTRNTASDWIYHNIPQGSVITHEIWDDGLPLARPSGSSYQYQYLDLDLYSADTLAKATTLSQQLASADVVIVASNRLVGSITRVPDTYPLTTHYYQLLYHNGLGFTLAHAPFQNYPHLGPFQLPDSQADESFSVYDHPTVWIFTRTGPRLTADQIKSRLLAGVALPPVATQLASQKTLLLTPAANAANQASPPLWQSLDPTGWATKFALPLWWLAIELLGLLAFPLAYIALPGLRDRGWGLAKALGILLLGYFAWLPASLGWWPYERATVWLAFVALLGIGGGVFWARRREMIAFARDHWRMILATEIIVLGAFLFFVLIRALDPDLWHIYRGGEKPMELAFLNAILRSRTMPPLDPWFAGGTINYYYFGQFLIATLIQFTGIVPTTAFNLAIPLLFALTISGAISVVGGLTGKWWAGVVAGGFVGIAGNLDGLRQLWVQYQATQAGQPAPGFDYWANSRVITPPFTINEFPYWSFLYADLHAHAIDLPIVLLGLGLAASLLLGSGERPQWTRGTGAHVPWATLTLAALTIGAMAFINTWDAPTYGLLIIVALLAGEWRTMHTAVTVQGGGWQIWRSQFAWPSIRRIVLEVVGVGAGAILLFAPFYAHFQSFVSGTGPVRVTTNVVQYLTVFGMWIFLILSFYAVEINDRLTAHVTRQLGHAGDTAQRALVLAAGMVIVLTVAVLLGVKALLLTILIAGIVLALDGRLSPAKQFTYLVILTGAAVALLIEIIYVRDFLDGGDWERMNTVFKFDYQIWLLWALGAALALSFIARRMVPSQIWNWGWDGNTKSGWLAGTTPATDASAPYALRQQALDTKGHEGPRMGDEELSGLASTGFSVPDAEFSEQVADISQAGESGEPVAWPIDVPAMEWVPVPDHDGGALVGLGLRGAWLVTLAVLLFGASVFLVQGTPVRLLDRVNWGANEQNQLRQPTNPYPTVPSLDGFAYMHSWFPGDAAAITWINRNIGGTPVILEASADPYQWFGRVSINTGLPAVLGWGSHEQQQRYPDEVSQRQADVTSMYSLGDPTLVLPLLQQYHVRYVYVGQLECAYYGLHDANPTFPTAATLATCAASSNLVGSLGVFDQLVHQGHAQIAYQKDGVTIYRIGG